MHKGTTPTLQIKVNGIDVSELTSIFLTLKQGKIEITKTENDISIVSEGDENRLDVPLTQTETLSLGDGIVNIQLRAMTEYDKAIASNIKSVPIEHILKEGIIR